MSDLAVIIAVMADEAQEAEESRQPAHAKAEVSRTPIKVSSGVGPVAPIALLIALIAVGVAIWALVKAPSEAPAHAAAQQTGDPKTRVCNVFTTVSNAVQLQTHADLGPDPVAQKAVAGNARLALIGGGEYLLNSLDDPKTPPELADAARKFAYTLQDIGMNALAEVPSTDATQAARLKDGEASRTQIADMCK
jgi:hypothetical protein